MLKMDLLNMNFGYVSIVGIMALQLNTMYDYIYIIILHFYFCSIALYCSLIFITDLAQRVLDKYIDRSQESDSIWICHYNLLDDNYLHQCGPDKCHCQKYGESVSHIVSLCHYACHYRLDYTNVSVQCACVKMSCL